MTKKTFDDIMQNRFVTPPSTNLSERVIAAASMQPNKAFLTVFIEEIFDMFLLPKPSYAMAFCIIFGLALGTQVPIEHMISEPDYFSFLTIESPFEEGAWL